MQELANTKMLDILRGIEVACERPGYSFGICYHAARALDYDGISADAWLSRAFCFLGLHHAYPVPHPDYKSNKEAYLQGGYGDKWVGPYGENRRHLLSLLIRLAAGESTGPADVAWPHPPKEKAVPITKRIESINNLQDLFNFTVKRVLANRRPAYDRKWNSCAYRTERIGGYRSCCVAGAVIPPELYTSEIEGKSILSLELNGLFDKVFPANIRNIPGAYEFLCALQEAHDKHGYRWAVCHINRKQFQQDFLNATTRVAQEYGLDHTQVR